MSTAFTDTYVRNLKSVGRYTDIATQGLNLQVMAGGGKYWTFRHQYEGKRQDLSLGTYLYLRNFKGFKWNHNRV